MHLKNRILLPFSPTLVTTDPACLAGLRNMHVRSIRERDDTPMASFIHLVLAAEDVRRKGDWITAGNEIQYFWRRGVRAFIHPCHWIYGREWLVRGYPGSKAMVWE